MLDRLYKENTIRELSEMFQELDTLLYSGKFIDISNIMENTDISRMPGTNIIFLLRGPFTARKKIPYYDIFLEKADKEFTNRGKDSKKILRGLLC